MFNRIATILGATLGLTLLAAPAMAIQAVPEPGTMSIFGVGLAAAFIANKLRKRK